jgi:hypothetical protein
MKIADLSKNFEECLNMSSEHQLYPPPLPPGTLWNREHLCLSISSNIRCSWKSKFLWNSTFHQIHAQSTNPLVWDPISLGARLISRPRRADPIRPSPLQHRRASPKQGARHALNLIGGPASDQPTNTAPRPWIRTNPARFCSSGWNGSAAEKHGRGN